MTDQEIMNILKIASLYDLRMKYENEDTKIYKFSKQGLINTVKIILDHERHCPNEPVQLNLLLDKIFQEQKENQ